MSKTSIKTKAKMSFLILHPLFKKEHIAENSIVLLTKSQWAKAPKQ